MKQITAALLVMSFCFTARAQVVGTSTTPPKVAVVADDVLGISEPTHDFGKIPQGKPVTYAFEVINNGRDSLKIGNIQASCGCTTPEWERNKVQAPGEKTFITVGYNAAAEGPFTKSITVSYNGTLTKSITIKGEVWKTPVSSAPENNKLKSLNDE